MAKILKHIWGVVKILIVVSAAIVLIFNLLLPVYQVQRSTMAPTFRDGDIVVFATVGKIKNGDVIAFYYGPQVLVKRVIGVAGDWVDISDDGTLQLNGETLDEPYVLEHRVGDTSIELPLQIPEKQFFVLGDQRWAASLDSRNEEIGLVREEQVIGKTLLRIWPSDRIGFVLGTK
jgi:signal peptidase I